MIVTNIMPVSELPGYNIYSVCGEHASAIGECGEQHSGVYSSAATWWTAGAL